MYQKIPVMSIQYIQDYFMAHLIADSLGNTVKLYRRRESLEK